MGFTCNTSLAFNFNGRLVLRAIFGCDVETEEECYEDDFDWSSKHSLTSKTACRIEWISSWFSTVQVEGTALYLAQSVQAEQSRALYKDRVDYKYQ